MRKAKKTIAAQPKIRVVLGKDGDLFTIIDGNRATPVIDQDGTFFTSTVKAGQAYSVAPTSISFAVRNKSRATGKLWTRATLEDCKFNGLDVSEVLLSKAEAAGKVVVVSKHGSRAAEPTVPDPVQPKKAKAPQKRHEVTGATFYGVRWPDGAVTIRANHGSSWAMTRASEEEIPKEMLAEAVWLNAEA